MSVGISTACFYPMLTEKTLPLIAGLGFSKIEVFFNTESECNLDYCADFKRRADDLGIEILSVHSFSSPYEHLILFSEYTRRMEDALKLYGRIIRAGNCLGARYVTFHGDRKINPADLGIDQYCTVLDRLIRMAREQDMYICQENVSWCKSSDIAFLRGLVKHLNNPDLRFTLDIKQANRAEVGLYEYIGVMGAAIANVHINDYDESHPCLLPGCGVMDYPKLFESLRQCGYRGDYIIEVYRKNYKDLTQIADSKTFLEKFF